MTKHPYENKRFIEPFYFVSSGMGHIVMWQCSSFLFSTGNVGVSMIFLLVSVILYLINEEMTIARLDRVFACKSLFFYIVTGFITFFVGLAGILYLMILFLIMDLFWIFYVYKTYKKSYLSINGAIL